MTSPSFRNWIIRTICCALWTGPSLAADSATLTVLPPTINVEVPASSPSPFHLAVSPDGEEVVTWVNSGAGMALLASTLGGATARIIDGSWRPRGTANGFQFWSPDGAWVAAFGNHSLQIIDRRGGVLRTLASAPFGHGGTWNRDNDIVFAPGENGPLYRVSASGGPAVPVTSLDSARGELGHRHPFFLPDGRHFLFFVASSSRGKSGIWIGSLDSPERQFLVNTPVKAVFAPPDTLFYMQGTTLLARPFDPDRLEFTGAPQPLVSAAINPDNGAAGFAVSANGVLAYIPTRKPLQDSRAIITVVFDWRSLMAAEK